MTAPASHISAQPTPSPPETGSGIEILDAQLAERGIVRVESMELTDSGRALYEINRELTDGSLDEALREGTIGSHQATNLTLDALRVVSEMHRMGLDAHGDIRPQNIFVDTRHNTAAIGGFHASEVGEKALSSFGLDVSHIATGDLEDDPNFSYLAPELALGADPDQRSDVYEGARTILFALISGKRLPPTVKYFDDVQGNGLEPAPAPELTTGFPTEASSPARFALQQALSPNPEDRQSMHQLIEEVGGNTYPVPPQPQPPQNALSN